MIFQINQPISIVEKRMRRLRNVMNYTLNGGTPLSIIGGVEGLAWVKTKYADPNDDWPDIQFHFAAASDVSDGGKYVRRGHGVSDAVWNEYFQPISETDTFSIMPVNLRPKSIGWIKLRSANPYDKPVINPNYYDDPQDLKVMIEGVKIAMALAYTKPFDQFGTKFYDKVFPGCEGYELYSDDYLGCWIKSYSPTMIHDVGTCKMGPDSDPQAVVDPQLRVREIKGLRVADNSIMPMVPSGNTMAPAVIITI
jgi:glucose dehydrogenase (acceptor)